MSGEQKQTVVITERFHNLAERFGSLMQTLQDNGRRLREAELKVARHSAWLAQSEAELKAVREEVEEWKELSEPYAELLLKLLDGERENLPPADEPAKEKT
jgi:hypothetical protein